MQEKFRGTASATIRRHLVAFFAVTLAAGCGRGGGEPGERVEQARSALSSTERILGFESTGDWSATAGTLSLDSRHVEGSFSLGVSGIGYTEISSALLPSLGQATGTVAFELLLPAGQPNPWWYGAVQLYLDLPSQGINHQFVGQKDLLGLPLDTFNHVEFSLPTDVLAALGRTYTDLRFQLVLNVPSGTGTYLFDRLFVATATAPSQDGGTGGSGGQPGTPTTVSIILPPGATSQTLALAADGTLLIDDRASVQLPSGAPAEVSNMGSQDTNIGVEARTGGIWSQGRVVLRDRAQVLGFIRTAGTVEQGQQVSVTGSVEQGLSLTPPQIISWQASLPSNALPAVMVPPDTQWPLLEPGSYESATVESRSTLPLRPGEYVFGSLELRPQSTVWVDDRDGPVVLYVRNQFIYRGGFVALEGGQPDLVVVFLGTDPVVIESPFAGTVVAPNARVELGTVGPPGHSGAFFAKDLEVRPDTLVTERPPLALLLLAPPGLSDCAALVQPREDLTGRDREVAYQASLLRYCFMPGVSACRAALTARANADYTAAALRVVSGSFTPAQYLAVSRDRRQRLAAAVVNPTLAADLCSGEDTDGDWVPGASDQCPDTPDLTATDAQGCPIPLPDAPSAADVNQVLMNMGVVVHQVCLDSKMPGLVVPGGFYWPSHPERGSYIVASRVTDRSPGCPLWYQFQIELLDASGIAGDYMVAFKEEEAVPDLVGIPGRPVPPAFIQFNPLPTESGARHALATAGGVYSARMRARAVLGNGIRGPWSNWKITTQRDCLSLGFTCGGSP